MTNLTGIWDSTFFVVWCGFLIYISCTETVQGHWFFAAWCIFILSLGVLPSICGRIRVRAIKQFATDHSLTYLDDLLPNGLILSFTSFAQWRCSTGNCLQGSLRGIPLAVFDLSHSKGKGSVSQTIVAFPRSGQHSISTAPIDAVGSYKFEAAGDWIISWIPRRIVTVEELEDWCVELHTLARDLLAEARGESGARPRLFRWMA